MNYKKKYNEIVKALTTIVNDGKKQGEQKHIECIKFTNEFEKQVSYLIASVLNGEYDYNEGFIKYAAQSLLEYAKKECINHTIQSFIEYAKKDQKPADKVEPKYYEGEWVVFDCGEESRTLQIKEITEKTYFFNDGSFLDVVDEDSLHLWTIQDAKDGDVLCLYDYGKPNILFKLKGQAKKHHALFYYFYYNIEIAYFNGKIGCFYPVEDIRPATNEQRRLLLMQMHCAGYEWYGDLKELYKENKQLIKDHLTF